MTCAFLSLAPLSLSVSHSLIIAFKVLGAYSAITRMALKKLFE